MTVHVEVTETEGGGGFRFPARVRLDTAVEVDYYRNGGILETVIRGIVARPHLSP